MHNRGHWVGYLLHSNLSAPAVTIMRIIVCIFVDSGQIWDIESPDQLPDCPKVWSLRVRMDICQSKEIHINQHLSTPTQLCRISHELCAKYLRTFSTKQNKVVYIKLSLQQTSQFWQLWPHSFSLSWFGVSERPFIGSTRLTKPEAVIKDYCKPQTAAHNNDLFFILLLHYGSTP